MLLLALFAPLASPVQAACSVTLKMPRDGASTITSPAFGWDGSCKAWKVELSPSGLFSTDLSSSPWLTTTSWTLPEPGWQALVAGPWAAGVFWRVHGLDGAKGGTYSEARFMEADPDADGDGWPASQDCEESDPAINPDASEICGNGVDDDCDGGSNGCGPIGTQGLGGADAEWRKRPPFKPNFGDALGGGGDTNGDGYPDVIEVLVFARSADEAGPVSLSIA